jgi:hypothetical protein
MYWDWRVVVGTATMPTARPGWPLALTRQGRRVHTNAGGRHTDERGGPATADSSLLVAGMKDAFVLVDVWVTKDCIEVEASHPEVAWGRGQVWMRHRGVGVVGARENRFLVR